MFGGGLSPISPTVLREGIPIRQLATQVMEKMPFADNSVDVVVGTLLLLSTALAARDNDMRKKIDDSMAGKSNHNHKIIKNPLYY